MLASQRFSEEFGKREVYSLQYPKQGTSERHEVVHSGARVLFAENATFTNLSERFAKGDVIKRSRLTSEFTYKDFQRYYGDDALPLFLVGSEGRLSIFATDNRPTPEPGSTLLSLVTPGAADTSARVSTTQIRPRPTPSTRSPVGAGTPLAEAAAKEQAEATDAAAE
jgi:hypothetical protein